MPRLSSPTGPCPPPPPPAPAPDPTAPHSHGLPTNRRAHPRRRQVRGGREGRRCPRPFHVAGPRAPRVRWLRSARRALRRWVEPRGSPPPILRRAAPLPLRDCLVRG